MTVSAQTISRATSYPVYTENVLVRNNNDKLLFVFEHNISASQSTNPNASSATTIYVTDTTMSLLRKICELPSGYRVHDAQFVTLHRDNAAQTPVNFCVFCGTYTRDTGYYYQMQWIPRVDSDGFVGLFYIDTVFQTTAPGSVYVRNIEGCKSLYKMVAYTETNGYYQGVCQNVFKENAVLDIVGLPKDTAFRASTVARVKFYPECNGEIRWDNNIRTPPVNSTEKVVDIIKEGTSIITASVFTNDYHTIWLRRNSQEYYFYFGGMQFTKTAYLFDAHTIISPAANPYNLNSTTFSLPVRLSPMGADNSVLSFNAQNIDNGITYYDGLFSLRFKIQNTTILDGSYILNAGTLKDVCSLPDTTATVLLTHDGSQNSWMYTEKWNNIVNPLYILYCTNKVNSVCRYNVVGNNGFWGFALGGLHPTTSSDFYVKLGYHRYFTNILSQDCMDNNYSKAPSANITISTLTNKPFSINHRYAHDPTNFPVTAIPIVYTNYCPTSYCSY